MRPDNYRNIEEYPEARRREPVDYNLRNPEQADTTPKWLTVVIKNLYISATNAFKAAADQVLELTFKADDAETGAQEAANGEGRKAEPVSEDAVTKHAGSEQVEMGTTGSSTVGEGASEDTNTLMAGRLNGLVDTSNTVVVESPLDAIPSSSLPSPSLPSSSPVIRPSTPSLPEPPASSPLGLDLSATPPAGSPIPPSPLILAPSPSESPTVASLPAGVDSLAATSESTLPIPPSKWTPPVPALPSTPSPPESPTMAVSSLDSSATPSAPPFVSAPSLLPAVPAPPSAPLHSGSSNVEFSPVAIDSLASTLSLPPAPVITAVLPPLPAPPPVATSHNQGSKDDATVSQGGKSLVHRFAKMGDKLFSKRRAIR